ncbi:DUF2968 domain-containing protein [Bacillus sp. DNRA2]|uniref:hypothetical protein n=1 Tax=Bacillus sp. DNRA2 TaxID=2723053 RepID=UPI00145C6A77|nr:hypothetical protein [Bacillus sp. DNRA2]NMD71447.1 DUF2968 domain-containing protein [Bacillus sp. DNRA2]
MAVQLTAKQQDQLIIHQFLSIALGGNSYLHPFIEEAYRKNEWEYYEAYQRGELKGNPLFSMYTTKSEEKIRQAAGLVEWCDQNHQFTPVDSLIKKGYKFAYQYMQQQLEIDFEHFMRAYAKRQKSKIIKEIDLIYQNIVLWYLCVREKKPFKTNNVAWESFQNILNTSMNDAKLQNLMFCDSKYAEHKEEIESLYRHYQIPKNPRFDSLGVFIDFLISHNLMKIHKKRPNLSSEKAERLVFQEYPTKYIGALGGWLKTLNIHELDATENIPFTKHHLDMVFLELIYAKKYNYISAEDQDLFFISCLYMQCLGIHYRETKTLYLDESKHDFYIEMKAKEIQIAKQEADLHRRLQDWRMTNHRKQKEIDGLTQELREAQSKIRQLEQQINELEDYSSEVHALRDYIYWEDHGEKSNQHHEKLPTIDDMSKLIHEKRIVIFGGSPNWRHKLKEHLPNVEFVDVDEKNRDISKIQRFDAVFINTSVFAHTFYKKIMKELNKCQTPLYYLNGQCNTERTILEMYRWLND